MSGLRSLVAVSAAVLTIFAIRTLQSVDPPVDRAEDAGNAMAADEQQETIEPRVVSCP